MLNIRSSEQSNYAKPPTGNPKVSLFSTGFVMHVTPTGRPNHAT
jgi:hypothetical protein